MFKFNTTFHEATHTLLPDDSATQPAENLLLPQYDQMLLEQKLDWTTKLEFKRLLGAGGQGVVYLSDLRGADDFMIPIALKIFSPEGYADQTEYDLAMHRIARVAGHVAQIQHDNLLDVHNFIERNSIRCMVMEWIDGYDLRRLLTPRMLERVRGRVSVKRWEYINRVVVTVGPVQPRIKAGVAVAIVRDCLSALAALHRQGVVHGDIKPSNIMLKRTGNAKIVDIGSAFEVNVPPTHRTCTPAYAAPEVIDGGDATPRSDLASLGYVLVELLSGQPIFMEQRTRGELLHAKRTLPNRLDEFLPDEVTCNDLLMNFCRGLIAPDPARRFPSAEAADLLKEGAAAFQRQLVMSNLASEYDNEIRLWLEELNELDTHQDADTSSH
ncbi:serine/threonine-protein kinase [Lignipirellula cremea]|uniref:Serine/threonine-protein kinase PrkC n=1 Tax=Lignipirellula cremea TaxID=2528010 RepID=A0A518E2G4_9BACT|nr:serine/threonine-protein kinase [Lignipirellula cremea]QDU98253.1 Serine/threonine-protein kinase PrkC [Lignipirellula cremea]